MSWTCRLLSHAVDTHFIADAEDPHLLADSADLLTSCRRHRPGCLLVDAVDILLTCRYRGPADPS